MTTGVLIYCFDTPEVNYHKLAERCVSQIQRHLALEVTIVTNTETHEKLRPMPRVNHKIVDNKTTNTRVYRGKNLAWYNKERVMAYDHSPYDTTILMDCDFFVFSDTLLELSKTQFDVMLHNRVHDLTGQDMIVGRDESTLPLVWATVMLFKKNKNARAVFDMVKHVQKYYAHYRNLYRIRYHNYRNDFAFAIAMNQCNIGSFIPTPMAMLADKVDILENDDAGLIFKYGSKVNYTSGLDVHVMEKGWCDV